MPDASTILLAAGLSRRMGAENKLLLPVNGRPMVRHVVDQYAAALDGEILVVLGHQSREVAATLHGTAARMVVNPSFAQGQATSVAAGLRAAVDANTFVIGLTDQPFLNSADIKALLDAHCSADPQKITIPIHGNARGNPIVVPGELRPRLLEDADNPGCRKFTRAHPELVQELTLSSRGYYVDVDTPEAYAAHFPTFAKELS